MIVGDSRHAKKQTVQAHTAVTSFSSYQTKHHLFLSRRLRDRALAESNFTIGSNEKTVSSGTYNENK